MIDEFGDEIAFEDLDTCCQKEVISNRRHKEVTAKLRVGDRSQLRNDARDSVFTNLFTGSKCGCCSVSKDYPMLALIRSKAEGLGSAEEDKSEESEESGSDLDLDDDYISPFELERKNNFARIQLAVKNAKDYGYAEHLDDSVDHILADILADTTYVLHVYNPSELLCGELDYLLEKLSIQYLGTKFRRVSVSFSQDILNKFQVVGVSSTALSHSGTLLCFHNKYLTATSTTFTEFSDGHRIYEEDVTKFLHGGRALSTELPQCFEVNAFTQNGLLSAARIKESLEQEDEEIYCDDPDCTRKYKHEHVGGANNTPASYMTANNAAGSEALAKNALYQL
eukprot:gene24153-27328_t